MTGEVREAVFTINNPNAPRLCPELAAEIGLNESILLLQIEFWIRTSSTEEHDGKQWTYQSVRDLQGFFCFWSLDTINRAIKSLETRNLILIGNFNKLSYDRTRWFALNLEECRKLDSIMVGGYRTRSTQNRTGVYENRTRSTQNRTTIPETTTENTTREEKDCEPLPGHDSNAEFDALPSASALPPNKTQPAMVGALLSVCIDDGGNGERYARTAAWLVKRGYTPEQVREHYGVDGDWYTCDWRGQKGQAPTQKDVRDTIFKAVNGRWALPQRHKAGKLDIIAEGIKLSQERHGNGRNDSNPVRQLFGNVSVGSERDAGDGRGATGDLAVSSG